MRDITPEHCFMLAAPGDHPIGPWLHSDAGVPPVITLTARSLPVSLYTIKGPSSVLAGGVVDLLTLTPNGPVTMTASGLAGCPAGWTVTSRTTDLGPVAGPQHAEIRAMITAGQRIFACATEEAEEAAEAYWVADARTCRTTDQISEWDAAMDAAALALVIAGADITWWGRGADLTAPLMALAARDLITDGGPFIQAHYDLLTLPWVTATGQQAHPADLIRAPQGDTP